jgi:magnesium-transporting ATPase (P-type)
MPVPSSPYTSASGLSSAEAAARLRQYGANTLRPPRRRGPWLRFLQQFHNVLIYMLLAAGLITMLLSHWIDSGVIFGVVLINAIIGFIQEGKAEHALEAIRSLLSAQAVVRRDGMLRQIPAEEVVLGDVVVIESGDRVPADLHLTQVKDLRVDESMLTGESLPVTKHHHADAPDAKHARAFSGTLVTHGKAWGVVSATGDHTELGRINQMIAEVQMLTTPLLRKLDDFGRILTIGIGVIAALTFAFGIWVRDFTPDEMFLSVVGLAVAAIPEGLPAIMTITLAIGVQRMARRHAIIRSLPAVETLGAVTLICSDKTGTLTCNQMGVTEIISTAGVFALDPLDDSFKLEGQTISLEQQPVLAELVLTGLLCNDASLHRDATGAWQLQGDPTEGALVTLAVKFGWDQHKVRARYPRRDVLPFESERRLMASLHETPEQGAAIYLKGAPEQVLARCTTDPDRQQSWLTQMNHFASQGRRMLALARKDLAPTQHTLDEGLLADGFTWLGMTALMDPPRAEAITAVAQCRAAGIRIKMITGDHAVTARAIATQIGIADEVSVLSGHDLDRLHPAQFNASVARATVFARTSPEHKLRLVEAFQAQGEVVAMTGDGVNDAPALKRADVGVAMGNKGSEVAKEAAEMVLTDDNFSSIAAAVEEGRTVYDNLKKAILFILPTNGGEALIIIAAIAMGIVLPITAAQILWVNMITAVTLALALAFEPSEEGVMQRPPRPPQEPLLSAFLLWRILFVSLILVSGTFGLFVWLQAQGEDLALARTVAVNTLVMYEIFYLFNSRYILEPVLNYQGLFGSSYVLFAVVFLLFFQLAFTYAPPMQYLFETAPMSAFHWLCTILTASTVLWLVEAEKWWLRRSATALN